MKEISRQPASSNRLKKIIFKANEPVDVKHSIRMDFEVSATTNYEWKKIYVTIKKSGRKDPAQNTYTEICNVVNLAEILSCYIPIGCGVFRVTDAHGIGERNFISTTRLWSFPLKNYNSEEEINCPPGRNYLTLFLVWVWKNRRATPTNRFHWIV